MPRSFLIALVVILLASPRHAHACAVAGEPPLAVLTKAALREAALDPARVRSLLRRARGAGFLPEVSFHAGKGAYDSLRTTTSATPDLVSLDTLRFDVTVRFPLDRWVFNPEEVRVAEAAGRLADRRARLLEHVAELWAERQRLAGPAAPHADARTEPRPDAKTDAQTDAARCTELTALLDALTGGALSSPRDGH